MLLRLAVLVALIMGNGYVLAESVNAAVINRVDIVIDGSVDDSPISTIDENMLDWFGEGTLEETTLWYLDSEETVVATDVVHGTTYGQFEMLFEVTAIGSDLFLKNARSSGTTMPGLRFEVRDHLGTMAEHVGLTTSVVTTNSSAGQFGKYFRIPEGETEEFLLMVMYKPFVNGAYRVTLLGANLVTEEDTLLNVDADSSFRTGLITLVGNQQLAPVPIPGALWLMMSGLFLLLRKRT